MRRVFYIDPQSYHNLSVYDYCLLSHIEGQTIVYFHNTRYDLSTLPSCERHAVFSYSTKKGIAKAASYLLSIIQIAYYALRQHPAVVHIQWFRWFAIDSLFVRLLHLCRAKIILTAHNVLPHTPTARAVRQHTWYYRHVDAIIVHAARTAQELQEQFAVPAERITTIPHGLLPMTSPAQEVAAQTALLQQQLHTRGKIVFACLGYQNYYKGIDLVADVWLTRGFCDNPQCMLLIAGQVQDAAVRRLEKCENVVVVDRVLESDAFEAYLRLATVALLPYRNISQSGVLLTCLERGLPVVVADVGGLTEPLHYAAVGWSIGQPTAAHLADVMLRLVAHPEMITTVAQDTAAFARIKEVYSWQKIGAATAHLYSSLINS